MIRKRFWQSCLAALFLCAGAAGTVRAEEVLAITSFGFPGTLKFGTISTAESYRVEWAPSPSGPWTNFTGASGVALDFIPGPGSGIVTCRVPMFYRVVATVTNGVEEPPPPAAGDYMVIHIAEGPSATSYPVSYLADVPVGGWTDAYKTTNIVLRRMPAGTFTMGSPTDELGRNTDEASHQATLSKDFYIGVFEITQKQWERVMGTWPSYFNNAAHRDARPVESVSYQVIRGASAGANWPATNAVDDSSFLGKLRARTGRDFDLPTECQWEYACRANVGKALNSDFNLTNIYFDAHMSEVGRYWYNGGSGYTQNGDTSVATAKVGSYLPNAWGLYDCHGNAWEWCLDRYGAYIGDVSDYPGAPTGTTRVFRGGGWVFYADGCRSARRGFDVPNYSSYNVGLRLVVPPDPDPDP